MRPQLQQAHSAQRSTVKPNFHYVDFDRNFPAGKVVDTNHASREHKPSQHVETFVTKSATNPFVSL